MTLRRLASPLGSASALALLAGAPAAWAATEDDQAWMVVQATAPLSDRVSFSLDTQARFSDDASRLGQVIFRPSIGWKLDATRTASLGYASVKSTPQGRPATHEHRTWQQLSYRIAGDGKGPTLTGRTRLEQRWVEDRDGTGWRIRQQVRFTAPVQDKVRAVVWTEPFIGFNETSWGQQDGLHVWRSFAGLAVPFSRTVSLEPGLLHQRTYRPGEDAVIQAAAVYLNLQF
ncbi:DUF2490 domain-containing protein [Phenylobacterium sp.]|uniref:DUF2490 domain-containing protein n=1 Tax=Phenylobacterium sp. TaxID=1871053 RepID=UPI0035AE53F1